MRKDLAMCYTNDFLGFPLQQNPGTLEGFNRLLNAVHPRRIIEIGTGTGGLAACLGLYAMNKDADMFTFDINGISGYMQEVFNWLNVDFCECDIFQDEHIKHIGELIESDGTTLLLCDNGNKPKEFELFAPHLKPGDIIMAHDYYTSTEKYEQEYGGIGFGPYWTTEICWNDVKDTVFTIGLQPFMVDIFKPLLWLCMRRV